MRPLAATLAVLTAVLLLAAAPASAKLPHGIAKKRAHWLHNQWRNPYYHSAGRPNYL